MLRDWRYLLALVTFAALGLLMFGGFRSEPPGAAEPAQQAPRYTLKTAQWTRLDMQGQPQFVADVDNIDVYDDESARLTTVQLTTTGDQTHAPWRLTAPSATAPARERRLLLNGPVLATGAWPDGEPLNFQAEDMWVEQDRKELHSDKQIEITGPRRQGRADGMLANWGEEDLQLKGKVEMHYVAPSR